MMASFGRRLLAWTVALALALVLVTLLVATGESIRHAEVVSPITQPEVPDRALDRPQDDEVYHHPGLEAWPTP